ncbi:MAG: porin family protein [Cytophagaceae bacterium]
MKKNLLVLVVCFFIALSPSFAQKSKFGLRVGTALTGHSGSDYTKGPYERDKFGLTAGFYVNSKINDFFWIKTDFNFVNKGTYHKTPTFGRMRNNLYYVDLYPISPTFHFKGVQIFAGPAVNFLVMNVYDDIENGKKVTKQDGEVEHLNRFDFGYVAGLEYQLPFGLNFGIRYVNNMSKLVIDPIDAEKKYNVYNRAILFTLGYTFGDNDD